LNKHVRYPIPAELMCPAAGQGALGIEIRRDDHNLRSALAFLDNADARAATACERALLQGLGGGCQVPIGAFAERKNGKLRLMAVCGRPDGSEVLREQAEGTDPETLGRQTAEALRKKGADRILNDIYGKEVAVPGQP